MVDNTTIKDGAGATVTLASKDIGGVQFPKHILHDGTGAEIVGTKTDAKSTATDATAVTLMSVFKQISASVQAAAASLALLVAGLIGGITTTYRLLSAAGTSGDATNVKSSAGKLYAIQGYNAATSVCYLKLYNAATAPTAGAGTPVKTLALPPSCGFAFDFPVGYSFSTGIGFTLVTGVADNNASSVTAADVLGLNVDYA